MIIYKCQSTTLPVLFMSIGCSVVLTNLTSRGTKSSAMLFGLFPSALPSLPLGGKPTVQLQPRLCNLAHIQQRPQTASSIQSKVSRQQQNPRLKLDCWLAALQYSCTYLCNSGQVSTDTLHAMPQTQTKTKTPFCRQASGRVLSQLDAQPTMKTNQAH